MAFRKSISQDELRQKNPHAGNDNRQASDYQGSRGGWFKPNEQQQKKR